VPVSEKSVIFGYSGHALVMLEAAELLGALPRSYAAMEEQSFNPFNLEYVGNERYWQDHDWEKFDSFLLGIGDNKIRKRLFLEVYRRTGKKTETLIHRDASISNYAQIGQGTLVARGAMVNPFSTIGENVILNTGCSLDHENEIGDHSHVAPGAVLAGNVKIGERVFVGANSSIREGVSIADDVVIGAGSVVVESIDKPGLFFGNPARYKSKINE
jgi:sugar O-acyltransferase (sialic acid O-acetyltransferase NeuD family)